jgi:hypothetical protein
LTTLGLRREIQNGREGNPCRQRHKACHPVEWVHGSGKDSVDHGRNGHDDHANAVCGVLQRLSGDTYFDLELWNRAWGDGTTEPAPVRSPNPPTMTQAEWDRITAPPRLIPDDVIRMFEKKP